MLSTKVFCLSETQECRRQKFSPFLKLRNAADKSFHPFSNPGTPSTKVFTFPRQNDPVGLARQNDPVGLARQNDPVGLARQNDSVRLVAGCKNHCTFLNGQISFLQKKRLKFLVFQLRIQPPG
ncbi:hypothetical protein [Abyssalbus ytuae]|uniref:Uncharacterized protein n=1 Tax=Abyssalbus ytuae TaxID=2926907 RepID=A0A9E7CUM2_9FLAO|nr:hypothetical protein [Abyssalbus ytuae]UOB18672.1 hypothetical protein MQE35_05120 [Abyssalbus ytuae]